MPTPMDDVLNRLLKLTTACNGRIENSLQDIPRGETKESWLEKEENRILNDSPPGKSSYHQWLDDRQAALDADAKANPSPPNPQRDVLKKQISDAKELVTNVYKSALKANSPPGGGHSAKTAIPELVNQLKKSQSDLDTAMQEYYKNDPQKDALIKKYEDDRDKAQKEFAEQLGRDIIVHNVAANEIRNKFKMERKYPSEDKSAADATTDDEKPIKDGSFQLVYKGDAESFLDHFRKIANELNVHLDIEVSNGVITCKEGISTPAGAEALISALMKTRDKDEKDKPISINHLSEDHAEGMEQLKLILDAAKEAGLKVELNPYLEKYIKDAKEKREQYGFLGKVFGIERAVSGQVVADVQHHEALKRDDAPKPRGP